MAFRAIAVLALAGVAMCQGSSGISSHVQLLAARATCKTYTTKSGDSCWAIADANKVTVANLETWNAKTFHWSGCDGLQVGFVMCVSSGDPPKPPIDPNAQCGPASKSGGACPLNACCSYWGYCGLTSEFCSTTGTQPCLSNCGDVTLPSCSGSASRKMAYYAGWATRRACTTVGPDEIDLKGYTHVLFAFATITQGLQIQLDAKDVDPLKKLVARKKDVSGLKVMIALGGWDFSEADATKDLFTYMIQTSAHRATFISSVKSFLTQYGLDGIDIDFEYPGAAERNAPADDTPNLTSFVNELRTALGTTPLISVAAPAGYWFLKGFQIDKFASKLSFVNMMSYDYHGPWDTNITGQAPLAQAHTSIKDMQDSVKLYKRAKIDMSKVNLGLAWYGRSYHLSSSSCSSGYNCTMTGGGAQGECTKASGTLAQFEIDKLISDHKITPKYDKTTETNWFTLNGDLITYDTDDTRNTKIKFAGSTCFGGTFVWSMDQKKGTITPPPPPVNAPQGCKDFDFVSWTKDAADISMVDYIDNPGEGAIPLWGWDDTIWHTYNGLETHINYIWQFGLEGTAHQKRIFNNAAQFQLAPNTFKENVGTSHDDALWGALFLMKYGEYYHDVKNDTASLDKYFSYALEIMNWVGDGRKSTPCAPGVMWDTVGKYQNTVTNALYLHALLRMRVKTGDKKYLDDAMDMWNNFFNKYPLKNADGLYIDGLSQDGKCTAGDGTTWTYNQGVMLSSFGLLYKLTGNADFFKRGNDLIIAVRKHLIKDGILAEGCDPNNSCNFDQIGFKGVFAKHMQYFYDNVGIQHAELKLDNDWHTNWIGLNARGIHQYSKRGGDGRLGSAWYGPIKMNWDPWAGISGLDGLSAAVKYGTCQA